MKRHLLTAVLVVLCTTSAWAQSTTFYLPQIADGMESGPAHWHTTIFIGNLGTATVSGTIVMTQSSGVPMTAQFVDELGNGAARAGQISFQLAPGQNHKYTSTAAEPLQVGFATVTANAPVSVNAVFSHYSNGALEFLIAEAGVPPTVPMGKQAIFVDTQFGFNVGTAIANPNASAENISLQILNSAGQVVASTSRSLGAHQHLAAFVSELFPGLQPMTGILEISAADPLVSMALRFDPKMAIFTTLFPFPAP
jgi:hypothetical protein